MANALTLAQLAALWNVSPAVARGRLRRMVCYGVARQVRTDDGLAFELAVEGELVHGLRARSGRPAMVLGVRSDWRLRLYDTWRGPREVWPWNVKLLPRLDLGHD